MDPSNNALGTYNSKQPLSSRVKLSGCRPADRGRCRGGPYHCAPYRARSGGGRARPDLGRRREVPAGPCIGWMARLARPGEAVRRAGNHALLVTAAASLLPHGLKMLFSQTRPDRRTVIGHVRGIPFSGKRADAFPSGHALHMGALASAAAALPAGPRRAMRTFAIGLSLTRVVVLAHWASDVVAGFVLGAVLERTLRLWTGYSAFKGDDHADS